MNISFVVLHYNNVQATQRCVKSLLKYKGASIIIVDNGSPNGKAKEIDKMLLRKDNVYLIESDKNLGFAKGNNIGYQFAKNNLHSDVIVLSNNDVYFEQIDFLKILEKYVANRDVDIAGPKIFLGNSDENENPIPRQIHNKKDIYIRMLKDTILLIANYFNGMDLFVSHLFGDPSKKHLNVDNSLVSDYQLHGSCLIFANRYVKERNGLYDKTFMYGEENILRYIADFYDYKMKYISELYVRHQEGGSSDGTYEGNKFKRRFRYKNGLKSEQKLLALMQNNNLMRYIN